MATESTRFDWRLVALVAVLVGAAVLQMFAAAGTGDDDVQLVVIGTASIVMLLAIGVVMWLVRAGAGRERE
ncbi:hypothetical protein [Halorussus caseinilyticus]|uniref:Uncharacterized protein n=1 Tax=Halorussus caseinilyticus TaxID=3034025 RepID=A0ABD5WN04_9EURY|nr:hypothetical protein [Halorussus sp. DT72]